MLHKFVFAFHTFIEPLFMEHLINPAITGVLMSINFTTQDVSKLPDQREELQMSLPHERTVL